MTLFGVAWKSIRQRLLASSLTGLSVALGVALMIAVLIINGVFNRLFVQDSVGYDAIIGPKGSQWQLVLNTIFRVDQPIAKMPWRFYQEIADRPDVGAAIPFAVSDFTEEGLFPIVATSKEFFKYPYAYGSRGEPKAFRIPEGHFFLRGSWDAVVGAEVARQNKWIVGSKFKLQHGGASDDGHVHDEEFTVQGVLEPTGTANDRTAFIDINGFFLIGDHDEPLKEAIDREMKYFNESEEQVRERYAADIARIAAEEAEHAAGGDHAHHHHHHAPSDLKKGVSAILVIMRGNPNSEKRHEIAKSLQARTMIGNFREHFAAQAVPPIAVITEIRDRLVGNIHLALLILTILIIIVSGIGIFVSIYNSMSERRREIGILRALGASRSSVFGIILFESMILCVGGGLLGLLLGHGLVIAAAPIIEARSGLLIDPFVFDPTELWLIPAMVIMATLVGFLPGLTAYRTNVAAALND